MRRALVVWILVLVALVAPAGAQKAAPFAIADNSFLVEEAFNQEYGVFQNIFFFKKVRDSGPWTLEFTQEWPFPDERHQLSYSIPFDFDAGEIGDILLNYRLQARMEDESGPAFSPRLSLILPTGSDDQFKYGLQTNLPVSKQFGDVYAHGNAGLTWNRREVGDEGLDLLSPHLAGSLIWRMLPLVHPMLEVVGTFEQQPAGLICCSTERVNTLVVSPGFRAALNFSDHQLVLGGAVPFTAAGTDTDLSLLVYVSYELPFRRK